MTPEQKSAQARQAAHASWARTANRSGRTEAAHAGLEAKIASLYGIPDGPDTPERELRMQSARRAYFRELARRSVAARAAKRADRQGGAAA